MSDFLLYDVMQFVRQLLVRVCPNHWYVSQKYRYYKYNTENFTFTAKLTPSTPAMNRQKRFKAKNEGTCPRGMNFGLVFIINF